MAGRILATAKRGYAGAAQGIGRGLSHLGVGAQAPPSRDRQLKHWLTSLSHVHNSMEMIEFDVPWWTYRAIDIVEAWLSARPHPIRVFEYGSGASTLWLAKRADRVTSVEHHKGFADFMAPAFAKHANIDFHLAEPAPSDSPKVRSAKEGQQGLDFADYVATIDDVGGTFDVIVVDGRARTACLAAALPHLAPDGMIIFDNSRRRRYRAAIESCGLAERRLPGLVPTLPYPDQTSLLAAPATRN